MSEPFLGEIRIFGFPFAPRGWATCDGQILPIAQNQALFALLGTNYGGNGTTTFALPDLRGRTPIEFGRSSGTSAYSIGQSGGQETSTLIEAEIPAHTHTVNASSATATEIAPSGGVWAAPAGLTVYSGTGGAQMAPNALSATGGSQPHFNMQPFLTLNFCIALQGIFPSRN